MLSLLLLFFGLTKNNNAVFILVTTHSFRYRPASCSSPICTPDSSSDDSDDSDGICSSVSCSYCSKVICEPIPYSVILKLKLISFHHNTHFSLILSHFIFMSPPPHINRYFPCWSVFLWLSFLLSI